MIGFFRSVMISCDRLGMWTVLDRNVVIHHVTVPMPVHYVWVFPYQEVVQMKL